MRLTGLDVLRATAILMVLGCHAAWPAGSKLGDLWTQGGWSGVDMFFVLSGFLVSGLLFNDPRPGRFLIRRAWKIYPAFWTLIAVTSVVEPASRANIWHELLFVQNYQPPMWLHTWSLGVEEHFYLLLPFVMLLLRRFNYKPLPYVVVGMVVICTLLRYVSLDWDTNRTPTHLRIDTLFVGVATRYIVDRYGVSSLSSFLVLVGSVMATFPFVGDMLGPVETSLMAIGNAALVAGVYTQRFDGRLWDGLAFIGRHSYSIYLWHGAVLFWTGLPVLGYICLSILVGILACWLIELPALRLRDYLTRRQAGRIQ